MPGRASALGAALAQEELWSPRNAAVGHTETPEVANQSPAHTITDKTEQENVKITLSSEETGFISSVCVLIQEISPASPAPFIGREFICEQAKPI